MKHTQRVRSALLVVLTAVALTSCAPYAVAPPTAPSAPAQGSPTATAQTPPATTLPEPAVVDSAPSREALEVLQSIPEPLTEAERIPPAPPMASQPASQPGPSAAAARDTAQVPIPEPTVPLGMRRQPVLPDTSMATDSVAATPDSLPRAVADSLAARPPQPGSLASPARPDTSAMTEAPVAAGPDSCWCVQIAAPSVRDEADAMRAAGESQLLVPFLIEVESGRYKVRSATCLDRFAALALRSRALAAGFEGSFPVLRVR